MASKVSGGRSKYAAKACQECRRRRAKCDGNQPACSRCIGRRIPCTYTSEDDGRGTAPKSYVRLLQARVNVLEQILWLHNIDIDASATQLLEQNEMPATTITPSVGGAGVGAGAGTGTGESPTAFDQLCMAFEGTLALGEPLNFDRDGEARYFGSTSGRLDFSEHHVSQEGVIPEDITRDPRIYSPVLHDEPQITEELESHLIEMYFTWEQPWCQVVDEKLFRQSRRSGGRYFSPLLLSSILASGSRFSDRPEIRTDLNDPTTAGRMFREAAEVSLHFDMKQPTITTLQSLAILGTVYVAIGQDAAGWLYEGMASRLVLDMGLHVDPDALARSDRITAEEADLRRQIYWALYCVDKLASCYTGRVCTMLDLQGAVRRPFLSSHTGERQASDEPTCVRRSLLVSFQNAQSTLSQILEKTILNLYAPKRLALESQRRGFFDSCLLALKSWHYGLPADLKPSRGGTLNEFPQAYVLSMVYHTTLILLAKPYIRETRGTNPWSLTEGPQKSEASGAVQKAWSVSLEAAKQICDLGDQYRKVFGSFRKSPITSTHCTLSAVLTLLSRDSRDGKSDAEIESIESGLLTLKELSTSWLPAGRYHDYIRRMLRERRSGEMGTEFPLPAPLCHQCPPVTSGVLPSNNTTGVGGIISDADQVPIVSDTEIDPALAGFLGQADMFTWMSDEALVGLDNAVPFCGDSIWGQAFMGQNNGVGGAQGPPQ